MVMIPIFDLKKQYRTIQKELDRAVSVVHARGNYILGSEVTSFEKEFSAYIGVPYGIGVASGTDALTLAMRVLKLTKADEVILPVNAYPTFFGIAMSGVTVRFVDCGVDGNIDPNDLKKRITKKTKAVVVVHLYGNPADIVGVKRVLRELQRSDIKIIEDCAQAHGATIGKKKVGTFGDIAVFSFYPSKNLGAYGDGGMLLTNHKSTAERLRRLRMYGEKKRYESTELSGVSRLDELQAAILRVKLRHLDSWNARRREIAVLYAKELRDIQNVFISPYTIGSCLHLFVIHTKKRDALKMYLENKGIGCAVHYPIPLHLIPALRSYGYKRGDFPKAETLAKEILSLPLYPELSRTTIQNIGKTVYSFFNHGKDYVSS